MGVTLTALSITCVAALTADGNQGLGLGPLSRAQPGRIVRAAPTGQLTVQGFNSLAPDAKRAYALGFVDGLSTADPTFNSMLRPQFMPCVTALTNDQVVDTIVQAVDALEPTSADTFVRIVANQALWEVCPSPPRIR